MKNPVEKLRSIFDAEGEIERGLLTVFNVEKIEKIERSKLVRLARMFETFDHRRIKLILEDWMEEGSPL